MVSGMGSHELASKGNVALRTVCTQHQFRSLRRQAAKQKMQQESLELKIQIAVLKHSIYQWERWWHDSNHNGFQSFSSGFQSSWDHGWYSNRAEEEMAGFVVDWDSPLVQENATEQTQHADTDADGPRIDAGTHIAFPGDSLQNMSSTGTWRIRCSRYTIAPCGIPRHASHFAFKIQRNVRGLLVRKRKNNEQVRLKAAEEESRRLELLTKLRALRGRIRAKRIIHQNDNDRCQFIAVLGALAGKKIMNASRNRRTNMTREEFNRTYGSFHKTWFWDIVCSTYCGETRDPMSKSDAFLDIVWDLYKFLEA